MMNNKQKSYYYFFYFSLLLYILWSQCHVHFMTGELGRLLAEGKLFFSDQLIITTNHFSYPNYDYPVANYHWFSAVLITLIHDLFGMVGLHIILLGLLLFAITKYYNYWAKQTNPLWLGLSFVLCIPLVISFSEMSMMVFAVLGAILFLIITQKYLKKELNSTYLYTLILLQLLWVNMHPSYYLAWFIVGATLVQIAFSEENSPAKKQRIKEVSISLVGVLLVAVCNPQYWNVWFDPFRSLFKDYKSLAPIKQSLFQSLANPEITSYFLPFYVLAVVLVGLIAHYFLLKSKEKNTPILYHTILFLLTSMLAIFRLEFAPFLGLVGLGLLVELGRIYANKPTNLKFWTDYKSPFVWIIYPLFPFAFWATTSPYFASVAPPIGLGLAPKALAAVKFIKQAGIKGPFFNNREAAGAILYQLHPQQRPFIDDRENGESNEFLSKNYFPYLNDNDLTNWHQLKKIYDINVIYFKLTNESSKNLLFLGNRLIDGEWALVYENKKNDVILLRKNKKNKTLIKKYQISF